jgi:ATP/ADP translocase
MNWLRARLHVESGEEMPCFLLFLYLALIFTSFLIIRTAKDALFLTKFSAETLAYLYVAVGVVMGLVIPLYFRITSRLGLAALITGSLAFFISNVLLLWWAARVRWSPLPEVFYV